MDDVNGAFRKLSSMLAPGGFLVMETGDANSPVARAMRQGWYYVNNLEHGLKVPSLTTILRLAVALNCKVMDLVGAYDKTDIRPLLRR